MTERPINTPRRRGFSLVEFLVVIGIIALLVVLLLPATRSVGPAARATQCKNNLKQIGLALLNYHDTYGSFPPAYTVDAEGRPLHSWRTLILPYLDQAPLFKQIDLSKPWDAPENAELFKARVSAYDCPNLASRGNKTTYVAIAGPDSGFRSDAARSLADFPPNSEALVVMEVDADHAVPWMSPQDASPELITSLVAKAKMPHSAGCHALRVDGTVISVPATMPANGLRAKMSISAAKK